MIRVGLAWIVFFIGDLVCRTIVNRTLGHFYEWPYRFYSWLMNLALDLQGDDTRGPWGPPQIPGDK